MAESLRSNGAILTLLRNNPRDMATTAAERQAAYRRRQAEGLGDKRLNTWISADASRALEHLARAKSMTQRAVLENLILAAAASAEATPDAAQSADVEDRHE